MPFKLEDIISRSVLLLPSLHFSVSCTITSEIGIVYQLQAVSCCPESIWAVVLTVIPVQEEKRKRAHNEEKEDPYPKSSVVFDSLKKK